MVSASFQIPTISNGNFISPACPLTYRSTRKTIDHGSVPDSGAWLAIPGRTSIMWGFPFDVSSFCRVEVVNSDALGNRKFSNHQGTEEKSVSYRWYCWVCGSMNNYATDPVCGHCFHKRDDNDVVEKIWM